jgi:hypothetical protein
MELSDVTYIAVAIQLATIVCAYVRIKERRTRYLGFLFLCVLVTYHGITEVFQAAFPDRNDYRKLTSDPDVARWLLWVTVAIAIYAAVYCTTLKRKKPGEVPNRPLVMARLLNWRLCLPLGVLLRLLSIVGRDYWTEHYWINGFIEYFSWLPLEIGIVSLILDKPLSWEVPIMISYAAFLALLASRFFVLGSMISAIWLLSRFNRPVRTGKMVLILGICGFLALMISRARDMFGREALKSDILETVANLANGARSTILIGESKEGILDDVVYRFDANSISSIYMREIGSGKAPAGFGPIFTSFFLCVPSFLLPSKLETDETARLDKAYLDEYYGLPSGVDYLVGLFGTFYGCYGLLGLLFGGAFMGFLYGWLDNELRLDGSAVHVLFFVCFLHTLLLYEQNTNVYMVNLRSTCVLVVILWVAEKLYKPLGQRPRSKKSSHRPDPRLLTGLPLS